MKKVLFVCLGNICRSPAAEGVFSHMIKKNNLEGQFSCDSAGTSAHHSGEKADPRSRESAENRGYQLNSLSRPFDPSTDFKDFDYIITMDNSNYQNVINTDPTKAHTSKVSKMTDYCTIHDILEVPDPYTSGPEGFEYVMDILEDACTGLLKELQK